MAKGHKAPVTSRAVIARINRKLAVDGWHCVLRAGATVGTTICST